MKAREPGKRSNSIRRITDYLWADEKRDFDSLVSRCSDNANGHIFRDLRRVDACPMWTVVDAAGIANICYPFRSGRVSPRTNESMEKRVIELATSEQLRMDRSKVLEQSCLASRERLFPSNGVREFPRIPAVEGCVPRFGNRNPIGRRPY